MYFNRRIDEVMAEFGTGPDGLTEAQVAENLEKYGPNKLYEKKKKSVFAVFLSQFKDLLVIILIIAAMISMATGNVESTVVILAVLILNAILGTVQYLKAEKSLESVFQPMRFIRQGVLENQEDRRRLRHVPRFVPAGQSTQMIVGATAETDRDILSLSSALYARPTMRRVYYSGYVSVNTYDDRLPRLKQPPLVRENRLYQADWLLRFYRFRVDEIVDEAHPLLDLELDPKLSWALRHPEFFPLDVNRADYEELLRVPGIGVHSARLIVAARRFGRVDSSQLRRMGVVMKKAQHFLAFRELAVRTVDTLPPESARALFLPVRRRKKGEGQLLLDFADE